MQPPSPFDKPEDAGSNPNPNPNTNPYGQPSPPNASPYGQTPPPNASPYGPPAAPPPNTPYGNNPYGSSPYGAPQNPYPSGGYATNYVPGTYPPGMPMADISSKKTLAGILGILLGSLGIHKFVLGYSQEGVIMLAVNILASIGMFCTFGLTFFICLAIWAIGLIEGIIYLTKNDQDFYNTYFVNKRPWF